ncbi:hypothetical protein RUM43_004094 [Polyplax serrata]|uniref:ATP-dependent RNA helicase n=1 Tax=Polyplax serrata TaxID=468196 RepID=A0AAN8SAW5_POLSC
MELFTVNRYTGHDDDTCNPNEEELRNKFLQKIKDRKRNSEVLLENNDALNVKHKKKKKSLDEDEAVLQKDIKKKKKLHENIHDEDEAVVQKSKKKKKKSDGNIHVEELSNSDEEKAKKKKSKKQKSSDPIEDEAHQSDQEDEEIENEVKPNTENQTAFTILKDSQMCKKEKVKRRLPDWLANPSVVSVDLQNLTKTVDSIPGLDKIFVDKLRQNNITHFFPVQHQIIPVLLENENRPYMYWPNDICVSAPTGSGKTLAFVLPILQVLYKRIVPKVRALVVLPVQDLANQVYNVFKCYSEPTNLNILLLTKLRNFQEEQKLLCRHNGINKYQTLVDIIVTTPGRLVEHLTKTKGLCLDELKYLVIDEADRVMENVQNDWLYHLNKHVNSECTRAYQVPIITCSNMTNRKRPPHKLLFSATLSQDPEKLQQLGLFYPKLFTSVVKSKNSTENGFINADESKFIGKYTTPAELTEYYCTCTKANKALILHHLIKTKGWRNILCFVNSAQATMKLAFILKNLSKKSIKIEKLSANLSVKDRDTVIQKFHKGEVDLLISSDALARGIDIPNVEYVVSYDCPAFVKTYIHRIGRTGRAGKVGTSMCFLTAKEVSKFNKVISDAGKEPLKEFAITTKELESYEKEFEGAVTSLAKHLENQKIQELKKNKIKKKQQSLASQGKFISRKKNHTKKSVTLNKKKKKKT